MQHHGSGNCHDGSNVALGDAIVVVSTDASESDDLFEVGEITRELGGCESLGVVGEVFLWSDSCVSTNSLKAFLRFESLMGVQTHLTLDKYKAGGVIDKDTPSSVHVVEFGFSGGVE